MTTSTAQDSAQAPATPTGPNNRREPLSPVDLVIVDQLRRNARTPNNAVAEAAGVAPSTCLSRTRQLERRGVLRGYHADVDPAALGQHLKALIAVRLRAGARHRLRGFTAQIAALPQVRDVFFLGGDDDFIVHVAVADSDALRDFVVDTLSGNPDVASTQTDVIFEHLHRW